MDRCRHVSRVRPAADHSILNPQKWLCSTCGTTESVWACLSCSNVACGRYNEEHALSHYKESKHPLAIEVNEKYVFCYICDEYILNDNAAGDIKILRSALSAIATHTFSDYESRGKRVLRSLSYPGYEKKWQDEQKLRSEDQQFTALKFRRYYLIARTFGAWRLYCQALKKHRRSAIPSSSRSPATTAATPSTSSSSPTPSPSTSTSSASSEGPVAGAVPGPRRPAVPPPAAASSSSAARKLPPPPPPLPLSATLRKRPVIPGVTGLRNLGNTCYMNSVLQVLRSFLANFSHVPDFREYFLSMKNVERTNSEVSLEKAKGVSSRSGSLDTRAAAGGAGGPTPSTSSGRGSSAKVPSRPTHQMLLRQSTIECFKHISSGRQMATLRGGLNGGGLTQRAAHCKQLKSSKIKQMEEDTATYTLCEELHALFRVMWSGKWAVVSPHKMLYAVWNIIPFFKGYSQQDAQEFLCEFIDKVQRELARGVPGASRTPSRSKAAWPGAATIGSHLTFISDLFQGQLISEVRCRRCGNRSQTFESFMDLSLEFPDQYQGISSSSAAKRTCNLEEMLEKFTETEKLDGRIYACEECNKRRRSVAARPTVLTEAEKQMQVYRLPAVLRLHLKRFMWGGRNNRGKITSHVHFEPELDLGPYCHGDAQVSNSVYELAAVVIHHGRGFGCGHYTTYCYNRQADSWVHCNDARVQLSRLEDVLNAQAYILFYTQKYKMAPSQSSAVTSSLNRSDTMSAELLTTIPEEEPAQAGSSSRSGNSTETVPDDKDTVPCSSSQSAFEEKADEEIVFNFQNSTIPKFVRLKRRLSQEGSGDGASAPKLRRVRSNLW